MTQEDWLTSHPYLHPSPLCRRTWKGIAVEVYTSLAPGLRWDNYLDDFLAGIPLPQNPTDAIVFIPAEIMLRSLVQKLAYSTLDDKLSAQVRILQEELRASSD